MQSIHNSIPTAQLGWHWALLEFHHLFKQQEGPDPPAYEVKTMAEILKHIHSARSGSKTLKGVCSYFPQMFLCENIQ